jgi:hypothetical protein
MALEDSMSPFLAAFVGGIVGGLTCGLVILVVLAVFGRRWAEGFFLEQVAWLERRFQERVLDGLLGHVTAFLDKSERIGQIAKRVVEVVQLLFQRPVREDLQKGTEALGAEGLAKAHSGLALALVKLGRDADARTEFEAALRLDADDALALEGLRELELRAAEAKAAQAASPGRTG